MLPHDSGSLSLAMHRPDRRHRLCLKKKKSALASHHPPLQANYKWQITIQHCSFTLSLSLFLTAMPGQTPLLLLNNMCRWPFVLEAAGCLLVHTFSQRASTGEKERETFRLYHLELFSHTSKCDSNFTRISLNIRTSAQQHPVVLVGGLRCGGQGSGWALVCGYTALHWLNTDIILPEHFKVKGAVVKSRFICVCVCL